VTRLLFLTGILFLLGSIVLLVSNYPKLEIQYNGQLVQMKIEKLPASCLGSKVRYFITFSYNGKFYEKATRGNFCETHRVGQLVDMKVLGESDTILFAHESALLDLISFIGLAFLGLVLCIVQWKKMN